MSVTIVVGALIFIFGAFITGFDLFQSGGGGGGPFGAVLAGPLLAVFGLVVMTLGSRRKRFSKRK